MEIVDDYFSFGSTAFYGEYYKNWKNQHDSDEDLIATLFDGDPAPDPAELKSSEVTGWGFGVVQRIESADTDLYLGFRNYQADFNLVDQNGKIETRAFEDFMTVTAGVTFHWGG